MFIIAGPAQDGAFHGSPRHAVDSAVLEFALAARVLNESRSPAFLCPHVLLGNGFRSIRGRPAQTPVRPNQRRGAGCRGSAILGWPCYDEHGLAGLNPDESATYCLDPAGRCPPAWFSLPADDVYVADGYADEDLAYFQLRPVPSRGARSQVAATNSVYLTQRAGL